MSSNNQENQPIELSIIVLSYNTKDLTKQTLQSTISSLKFSQLHYEIIVCDNDSKDGSKEMLTTFVTRHPEIRILLNKENLGYSKGNNFAAKSARGKYVLFLNSDIIVVDDAIVKLLNYLKKNTDCIDFLGGKLLNLNTTPQPSCGPFYSLSVVFGALFLRGDYWGLTRQSPRKPKPVDWVSGACLLTSLANFNKLHGFDEQIFMYMDEIDLLFRARKERMKTWFYPDAQFIHLGSASSGGKTYPILQVYKGFRYFYKKHHSASDISILKGMLQLKAHIALWIGKLTHSSYLIQTYAEALKVSQMD